MTVWVASGKMRWTPNTTTTTPQTRPISTFNATLTGSTSILTTQRNPQGASSQRASNTLGDNGMVVPITPASILQGQKRVRTTTKVPSSSTREHREWVNGSTGKEVREGISLEHWMQRHLTSIQDFRFYFHVGGNGEGDAWTEETRRRIHHLGLAEMKFFCREITHVIVPTDVGEASMASVGVTKKRRVVGEDGVAYTITVEREEPSMGEGGNKKDSVLEQARKWDMRIWTVKKLLKILKSLQPINEEEEITLAETITRERTFRGIEPSWFDIVTTFATPPTRSFTHKKRASTHGDASWITTAWCPEFRCWKLHADTLARYLRRLRFIPSPRVFPRLRSYTGVDGEKKKAIKKKYVKTLKGCYLVVADALGYYRPAMVQEWNPVAASTLRLWLPPALDKVEEDEKKASYRQGLKMAMMHGWCPFDPPVFAAKYKSAKGEQAKSRKSGLGEDNVKRVDEGVDVKEHVDDLRTLSDADQQGLANIKKEIVESPQDMPEVMTLASGIRDASQVTKSGMTTGAGPSTTAAKSLGVTGSTIARVKAKPSVRELELLERRTRGFGYPDVEVQNASRMPTKAKSSLGTEARGGEEDDLDTEKALDLSSAPKRAGFCEHCRVKYDDLDIHAQSVRHRRDACDEAKWKQVDALLAQLERPRKMGFDGET